MFAVFFIGKRTLFDILRTGIFWVALGLMAIICFVIIFYGWRAIEDEVGEMRPGRAMISHNGHTMEDPDIDVEYESWDPFANIKPETIILWYVYGITIGFANLLSIFIMMGLIGREIDRRTIDILLARPVTRGQIFFGKLLAGWMAIAIFMALICGWTLICQVWGGMGAQPDYVQACATGAISPFLIGAITLVLTIWMRGFLAGLLGTIITFTAGTGGLFMIKILGIEVLKLEWIVRWMYRTLPPLNVIGKYATDHLELDTWSRFTFLMFEKLAPSVEDGLYSEMWHVWVYMGIVILAGWLSFFRRQFN